LDKFQTLLILLLIYNKMSENSFIKKIRSPFWFRIFLLNKLPSAFFSGLRIKEITTRKCSVSVPYKWFTKNPFRSTYFASLAMAAELSTGALAMSKVFGLNPPVSMLVTKLEATYYKKAANVTVFTCCDGEKFDEAINKSIQTGEGIELKAASIGFNKGGEKVAEFFITWSFKKKQR
jgi:hypothetical protein